MLCACHTLQPKEKVGIRETVVKYEMKAQLEKEDWIMFSFFTSVPLDIKNMGLLRERNLLPQGVVHNLRFLKGVLIREKPCVLKQSISKPTGGLIAFVIDKDFSGRLRLRVQFSSLRGVLLVKCIDDELLNMQPC